MFIYNKNQVKFNPFLEIENRVISENFNSFIYIVPTRRKIRFLIRELINKTNNKTIPRLNIFTIGTFAEKLFTSHFTSYKKITEPIQFALYKKILSEIDLKYFLIKEKYISNGIIELLIAVITRLKELGIDPESFKNNIKKFDGEEKLKLEDISKIYNTYQVHLEKLKLYETGDIYLSINSFEDLLVENIFRKIFPTVDYLLIAGFHEFSKPELSLIEKIFKIQNLNLLVTLDYSVNNEEIFGNLIETHNHLINIGLHPSETNDFEKNTHFHFIIKNHLFKSEQTGEKNVLFNVFLFEGEDIRDEIETIAQIIKNKAIENPKLELNKICIAVKNISLYSNYIREIFFKYGIPVNVSDRFYLKNSPPIIAIVNLLRTLKDNFNYKRLFNILTSPYFDFSDIDQVNLYNTLKEIHITQGKEKIIKAIENRIEYYSKLSQAKEDFADKKIYKLKKALEDFQKIVTLFESISQNHTPRSFINSLRQILKKLKIDQNIFSVKLSLEEKINQISYEKDVKALNLFENILEELIYLFEKLIEQKIGVSSAINKFSFNDYFNYITSAIFGARYNLKERWGYGVLVTSPNEIRGLSFDILFMPDLINGDFPSKYTPLIFLQEEFIKNDKQHLLEDRYLFYQALNSFEKELYLSYPKGTENREYVKSDFLHELQNIFELQIFDKSIFKEKIFSSITLFENFSYNQIKNIIHSNEEINKRLHKVENTNYKMQLRKNDNIESVGKEFCGIITSNKLINQIKEKLANHSFSITELEIYAKCPYRYFIEYILQPEYQEEIEEDIPHREFGILIHNILERFFKKLNTEGRNFYKELLDQNSFYLLEKELKSIAEEECEFYEKFNPYFFLIKENLLGIKPSTRAKTSILSAFLAKEKELSEQNYIPSYFEYPIKQIISQNYYKINLEGKLDRIDIDNIQNRSRIIDYKTGQIPSKKYVNDKISLQLPLYIILCKEHFKQNNLPHSIDDACFFQLKYEESKNPEILFKSYRNDYLDDSSEIGFNKALEEILNTVAKYIELIRTGKFHLTRIENYEDRICNNCNYEKICRIKTLTRTSD